MLKKKSKHSFDFASTESLPDRLRKFLLNKRKGSLDDESTAKNSQFSTSDSVNSRKKETLTTFPLKAAKSVTITPSSDTNSRGIPHSDDRIQTTFTVSPLVFDESDEMMMDMKKPFQAPPNPPPPIPNHKRHLNGGSPTDDFASSSVNGSSNNITNGFKASTTSLSATAKKPQSVIPPPIMTNGATKFSSSKELRSPNDRNLPILKLNGFVGFDSLPYQLVHKCQKQGFQFNLLVCGETGTGKTTLVESLFNMKLEFEPCNNELKTVELRTKTCGLFLHFYFSLKIFFKKWLKVVLMLSFELLKLLALVINWIKKKGLFYFLHFAFASLLLSAS
jgi:hypothetical protein